MRRIFLTCLLVAAPVVVSAQTTKPVFMEKGAIEHSATSGHLRTNHPRPLFQALAALSEEYGVVIDFEEPPYYSKVDLVDDTDPQWRASHPQAKGVTRGAGGSFETSFPEPESDAGKEQILEKVISNYNSSGNPGKFSLRKEGDNRYAVVGIAVRDDTGKDESTSVLLDTPITVSVEHRSAFETLNLVLDTLSDVAGVKVHASMTSTNGISAPDIVVGGSNVPARTLLLQTLDAANKYRIIRWDLLYYPDGKRYFLSISPALAARTDSSGARTVQLLDRK